MWASCSVHSGRFSRPFLRPFKLLRFLLFRARVDLVALVVRLLKKSVIDANLGSAKDSGSTFDAIAAGTLYVWFILDFFLSIAGFQRLRLFSRAFSFGRALFTASFVPCSSIFQQPSQHYRHRCSPALSKVIDPSVLQPISTTLPHSLPLSRYYKFHPPAPPAPPLPPLSSRNHHQNSPPAHPLTALPLPHSLPQPNLPRSLL